MDFRASTEHILTNIDDLLILTHPGAIFYESGIHFYLFGHWGQISDNWRYWLHIKKVYIHSYFTLVDCEALWKHIVTNNGYFVILTPHGANFLRIWDILSPIWLLLTKWRQLEIWVANAKTLYQFILDFHGFWGIEEAYFEKYLRFSNFDPFQYQIPNYGRFYQFQPNKPTDMVF